MIGSLSDVDVLRRETYFRAVFKQNGVNTMLTQRASYHLIGVIDFARFLLGYVVSHRHYGDEPHGNPDAAQDA